MKRKLFLLIPTIAAIAIGVVGFSAFEAHIINVTAHIENALAVDPEPIQFGTVFPQEYLLRDFSINLSESFIGEERVDDVNYVIKQKTKCICSEDGIKNDDCEEGEYAPVGYATHECPVGFEEMQSLCPFLSKTADNTPVANDTSHLSYYNDLTPSEPNSGDEFCPQPTRYDNTLAFGPNGWAGWSCPSGTHAIGGGYSVGASVALSGIYKEGVTIGTYTWPAFAGYTYQTGEEGFILQNDNDNETISYYVDCLANNPDATGMLTKDGGDTSDLWTVDLKVPPVAGTVGQDWPAGCPTVSTNDQDYGCDLWVEVTNISRID